MTWIAPRTGGYHPAGNLQPKSTPPTTPGAATPAAKSRHPENERLTTASSAIGMAASARVSLNADMLHEGARIELTDDTGTYPAGVGKRIPYKTEGDS